MKLGGTWRIAWNWFLARRQQAGIDATAELIKAGNLRAAIKSFEDMLPQLKDRTARAVVLHRLVRIRLQFAHRLARAEKSRAAQREFRATMRLVGEEVTNGLLSPGKAISLVGYTLERLTHYHQTAWISELRATSRPAARQAVEAAQHLEAMTLSHGLSPVSAQDLVREIPAETMPMAWWMTIYDLLYRQGLVSAAVVAKQAAAGSFLAGNTSAPVNAMHLAAVTCLGDEDRIKAVIDLIADPTLKRDGWLALGEIDQARALHASVQSISDRRFAHWVEGRSVAIVGPARNMLNNGKAIDAHDRVVRTNFIANDAFRAAASMIGSRTDAAYYNSIFLQRQPEAVAETLRRERVEFAMLRTPIERMRLVWQTRGRRTRAYYFTPSIFMARGYAMRHILHDLALMPTDRITSYGSDFFLGANSHFAGYATWRHAFDHAESYIVHDPLDCWRFMKRLLNAGLMTADTVLDEILRLDERDFILAIERRFQGPTTERPGTLPSE